MLWGLSSALASGTFEAFTYDELAAVGQERRYAQVIGWTTTAGLVGLMLSNLAAAPLIRARRDRADRLGQPGRLLRQRTGRPVAAGARARRTEADEVTGDPAIDEGRGLLGRWVAMLRAGTRRRPRILSSAARWC